MDYIFNLKGEVPAKKNSRQLLKNKKNIPSENYQKWHKTALFQLIFQRKSQKIAKPLNSALNIEILLTHGDLRDRDGDNGETSVLDTLKDARIIEDDNWKICRKVTVENFYDKNNSSCKILISPYKE